MFIKLVYKHNYAYLFLICAASLFLSQLLFGKTFAGIVFSIEFYYLSVIQFKSGIALDRSWTAEYKKEEHPFLFSTIITLGFVVGTLGLYMILGQ
jgi:hypothetical protein